MMYNNLKKLMRSYNILVKVEWETTCYPFHENGEERKYGNFQSTEADAKSWAHHFVHNNPMGAVKITPI